MIPIVFAVGVDPVQAGLVATLAHPGSNATGVSYLQVDLGTKRVGLLHALLPNVQRPGAIMNPDSSAATVAASRSMQIAGSSIGRDVQIFTAANSSEIDLAFAEARRQRIDALLVNADPLFFTHREQIVSLAEGNRLPTIYPNREYADAGGLMSYGPSLVAQFHQAGVYTGRVLKGEKPADLPVWQSSRFEFVINAKAAKLLGLEFHPQLLATADEVIE
jgi:putative ABC transport system substrate-binding protein